MKILFISSKNVSLATNGGEVVTNRNYETLCDIAGVENVKVINVWSNLKKTLFEKIEKRFNYLLGFNEGLNKRMINHIIIQASDCDWVFIEVSYYGVIAKHLKHSGFKGKVIVFFHNVEYDLAIQKAKRNILKSLMVPFFYYNERCAMRYSDICIVLNSRDQKRLHEYFGYSKLAIIPISMKDSLNEVDENSLISSTPRCLFVGSNWYPNIQGIKWFILNVLDFVDIKLQIAGRVVEALGGEVTHPKIEILGYVKDLNVIISQADVILLPVFKGGGMKVKTCEGLMFGKNMIGTKEAFEGYDIDYSQVGAMCNTREEFIKSLKEISSQEKKRFNKYSREEYIKKYSYNATLKQFKEIINKRG